MMIGNIDNTTIMTKEQAIGAVLKAERNANLSIEKYKKEEERILQEARRKAQRIIERTEHRMAQVHRICDRLIVNEVHRIEKEAEDQAKQLLSKEVDFKMAQIVVERVAEILTQEHFD